MGINRASRRPTISACIANSTAPARSSWVETSAWDGAEPTARRPGRRTVRQRLLPILHTPCGWRRSPSTIPSPMPGSWKDSELVASLPPLDGVAPQLLELPAEDCQVDIRTGPPDGRIQPHLGFLLGSCRYPGLLWKAKRADRIFGPMRRHLVGDRHLPAARFTLMMGDQIYADKFYRKLPMWRADTYGEFQDRYVQAFGSPNMRRLLRTAPTYMILDDHEIEDNWTQDRIDKSYQRQLYDLAIGAYMSYQWSHGPRSYGRLLYYRFECGGYPFFVLDTRTQRYRDRDGLEDNHLLGRPTIDPGHKGQLRRLTDWLSAQQQDLGDAPKFIVSPSVFAPNPIAERLPWSLGQGGKGRKALFGKNARKRGRSDTWPAYPNTKRTILEHILAEKIQNVVFLTGDIHCSNVARMEFEMPDGDSGLIAYDVTSSAFYWPHPFADGNPNDYVHDSRDPDQLDGFPVRNGAMHYRAWGFTQEDNFCRIDIDRGNACLHVRYFDQGGGPISVRDDNENPVTQIDLSLAGW